jgi:formamidopyrimidine-DNA glycosylase
MPELPEAEVVARQLCARLIGGIAQDWQVGRADIVREGFPTLSWYRGAQIVGVARVGKSVAFSFSRGQDRRFMVAELGMTGLLLFTLPSARYEKHTHLTLRLDGCRETALHYWNPRRFGRLHLLDRTGLDRFLTRRFGCDPLTVSWEVFRSLVARRRGRLKALLMHQQAIAGIGNIYANEILFRAGLHPYRQAGRLREPAIRRLYETMREVLGDAIAEGGSSIRDYLSPDGQRGRYARQHRVYNKAGLPCPNRCGDIICRLKEERSSFYCRACQPRSR